MPTLNWIGKEKVVNHHQDVPYRILEHQYTFNLPSSERHGSVSNSGNKIIHGDNLEALKSLLPEYEGKIKCIYIDPPYNTGNEGWVYNDNVNHPKIKRWLGEVVGKQGEDLTRHDKWLCMMYPRLKLLHKLLSDDGAIFISIDDNEQASLKLMMDEIFGGGNFINTVIWHKKYSVANDAKFFSSSHDFIIVYAKGKGNFVLNRLPRTEDKNALYKNIDNDPRGVWQSTSLSVNRVTEKDIYEIVSPKGKKHLPPNGASWRFSKEKLIDLFAENRITFGKDGNNTPRLKRFLSEIQEGLTPTTIWKHEDVGHTDSAKKDINKIFGKSIFDFPKPATLIERILQISTDKESLILDSFAGSGTTAHAVLNLNNEDGGNRKFILIEMEDYAETITAERVKRVINGYGEAKNEVEGTGGSFDYYELGKPIFKEDKNLNEEIGEDKIREYIYYTETKQYLTRERTDVSKYLLDTYNDTGYYFYYEKDRLTILNSETLNIVTERAGQYLIYADICLLDTPYLLKNNIIFKKIPRDIKRF